MKEWELSSNEIIQDAYSTWDNRMFSDLQLGPNLLFCTLSFGQPLLFYKSGHMVNRPNHIRRVLCRFDKELNTLLVGQKFFKKKDYLRDRVFWHFFLEKHSKKRVEEAESELIRITGIQPNIPYDPTYPHLHGILRIPDKALENFDVRKIQRIIRRTWRRRQGVQSKRKSKHVKGAWFDVDVADAQVLRSSYDIEQVCKYATKHMHLHLNRGVRPEDMEFLSSEFVNPKFIVGNSQTT